jgi:hypothetical protein
MQATIAKITCKRPALSQISHKRHEKYSPNLYSWFRRYGKNRPCSAYRDNDNNLWLGYYDEDGWFMGQKVIAILCEGSKAGCYFHHNKAGMVFVEDFWDRYLAVGRCAIDPDHQEHFLNAKGRYAENGNERVCRWCGQRQGRSTATYTTEKIDSQNLA